MHIQIYIIILVYMVSIIILTKKAVFKIRSKEKQKLLEIQNTYEKSIDRKKEISLRKKDLEEEAVKNFTLYELTKDITKHFSEEQAFQNFQSKLKENIQFSECQLLDPLAKELKVLQSSSDYSLFPLIAERKKIGYLAIKGISESDKEKFVILIHQFALAMRRVKLNQEIEKLAITDSLTEVNTRRYLMERLEEELNRAALRKMQLSLLMIDVDYFKRFNDEYGHLTGDQILREIGKIIKQNIREIDIAGRYGGEEVSVVLPDTNQEGAKFAAERIRSAVEKADIKAYDTSIKTTVSIGMTTFPIDGRTDNELIDRADWALYRAKKLGRNLTCAFGIYND